jgi:hypothetical protein
MMNTDTYVRVRALFDEAMQMPSHERRSWVRSVCADNAAIADLVRTLIAAAEAGDDRFEASACRSLPPKSIGPYEIDQ